MARLIVFCLLLACATTPACALEIRVDTSDRILYLVENGAVTKRYPVAVGAPGKQWSDVRTIHAKHWQPAWQRSKGSPIIPGGSPKNPMGVAALMLDDLPSGGYAIHGTNQPDLMGQAVSRGCIRMRNKDIADLFDRVSVGTRVHVVP